MFNYANILHIICEKRLPIKRLTNHKFPKDSIILAQFLRTVLYENRVSILRLFSQASIKQR